jgi:hypothetical protein
MNRYAKKLNYEERYWWNWLAGELGVTLRPRRTGRPPTLGRVIEHEIWVQYVATPRGKRSGLVCDLAERYGVSRSTIHRARRHAANRQRKLPGRSDAKISKVEQSAAA